MPDSSLTLAEIHEAAESLRGHIVRTPTIPWVQLDLRRRLVGAQQVFAKLELLQHTGTFKARGALLNVFRLSLDERSRGITAVSAGNHAIAVAWAAQQVGVSAKIVMLATANARRAELVRRFDAEVIEAPTIHEAFATADRLVSDEGRSMIHPFEGRTTALATATIAVELFEDIAEPVDQLIVPVGGGGLIAGMASAAKLVQPDCVVIGVEPEGADSMHQSFAAGTPQSIERVTTIADSLGAPYALPLSFSLARANVDQLVRISDEQMTDAMRLLFYDLKLAVEPAGAAATAALVGPLAQQSEGKRTALIVCGANIDLARYSELLVT